MTIPLTNSLVVSAPVSAATLLECVPTTKIILGEVSACITEIEVGAAGA